MPGLITHIYIAKHISKRKDFLLGNVLPDTTLLIVRDRKHILSLKLANILMRNKKTRYVGAGIKTHVLVDKYMHPHYVLKKAAKLSRKIDLDIDLAHGAIESAMGRLLLKKYPELKKELRDAIKSVSDEEVVSYLKEVIYEREDKILEAVRDARKIGLLKNPYSFAGLIKKLIVYKKYKSMKVAKLKFRNPLTVMKNAKNIVEEDYMEYLNKCIEIGKKTIKNL
ncbi:hypothetical protein J4426_02280 [Candidatus Woesearchaeota archaeon]|nr:hypothetical protein [Candidatus Woesearchaeota archaeon]